MAQINIRVDEETKSIFKFLKEKYGFTMTEYLIGCIKADYKRYIEEESKALDEDRALDDDNNDSDLIDKLNKSELLLKLYKQIKSIIKKDGKELFAYYYDGGKKIKVISEDNVLLFQELEHDSIF